jgi:hypothetical protein
MPYITTIPDDRILDEAQLNISSSLVQLVDPTSSKEDLDLLRSQDLLRRSLVQLVDPTSSSCSALF